MPQASSSQSARWTALGHEIPIQRGTSDFLLRGVSGGARSGIYLATNTKEYVISKVVNEDSNEEITMNNTIRISFRHRLCAAALATALFVPASAGVAGASTKQEEQVKPPQSASLTSDVDEREAEFVPVQPLIVYFPWCATRPLLFPWRCP